LRFQSAERALDIAFQGSSGGVDFHRGQRCARASVIASCVSIDRVSSKSDSLTAAERIPVVFLATGVGRVAARHGFCGPAGAPA
jgi:hypothetical protein